MQGPFTSVEALVADLRRLGVAPGDTVMVHASLRAVGPVAGGAAGVLDALETAVGSTGTLLMVLGARDEWAWVNERPEPERAELLRDAEPFDHLATPADPEVGVLAEVFRRRRGTLVSNHPEGRFAAAGLGAAALVKDVPWDDYFGPGSPLDRLVEVGGKVLRLGADRDTLTLLHYAEYLAPVPAKRRVRRHRVVLGAEGPELRVVDCLDDVDGIVDHPGEDYFATILREYLGTGRAATGVVGRAPSELLDAADVVAFAVAWMGEHLARRADRHTRVIGEGGEMEEKSTTSQDAAGLVRRALEAVAAKDLDALETMWHDEVVDDFVPLEPVRGKPAARAFFAELFAALPDLEFTIERVLGVDATTAVGEWSLRGTFDGGPFQGIEPTGREVTLRGVDVMEFEDGLLRHNTIYYDGLQFARQVGLLPSADSGPDRAMLAAFNAFTKAKRRLRR